jgi:serine/threonine protein kinase
MTLLIEANAEPIPGYRLVQVLGKGGFGEVWKCVAPGGLFKAIKIVDGPDDLDDQCTSAAEEEWQAVERIKDIRHPFLLSLERVERVGGSMLLVMELADTNLHHVMQERQLDGKPGIPREELLGYLGEAAEVLDLLNDRYELQHLDIKPRNLFLVGSHVKVADFGLVSSLGRLQGGESPLGAITPLYCSPEVFQGSISPQSDQYSLAIVYCELLTGVLPFDGRNARQLMMQHTHGTPDLRRLPPTDLAAVARALSKEPEDRFPSCGEFLNALRAASIRREPSARKAVPTSKSAAGAGASPRAAPQVSKGSDSLAGYRFVRCLERGPLTEVWHVEAPGGKPRLLKFIFGFDQRDWQRQRDAVAQLKTLEHPALAPVEVVDNGPGKLALVTDLLGKTLRDRWQECRSEDLPGIPSEELLNHLAAAAEALDALFDAFALPHLALNPRALRLDGGRLSIADFGVVPLFWLPAGRAMGQINPRYYAPELATKQITRAADQYSLALVYHEMLTGTAPRREMGRSGGFNLSAVDPSLRSALGRALADDPAKRFPTCTGFVEAMAGHPQTRESK